MILTSLCLALAMAPSNPKAHIAVLDLTPVGFFGPGTTGPSLFNSATDSGDDVVAWTNPTYVLADDSNYATAATDSSSGIDTLILQTPLYTSIPSNATINGIEVTVRGHASINPFHSGFDKFVGTSVRWRKSGGSPGVGYGTDLHTTDQTYTFGGSTDLWSTTWTPSDLNNSGLQLWQNLQVIDESDFSAIRSGSINWVKAKVYYTTP